VRTVKELKEELSKFPDDAVCFAYEGEVHGIVIEMMQDGKRNIRKQGVIHCGESCKLGDEGETELE
jgi:hypothetical protein